VARSVLYVSEAHPSVKSKGDESVTTAMGAESLGDPSGPSESAHDPGSGVTAERFPVSPNEQRARGSLLCGSFDGVKSQRS